MWLWPLERWGWDVQCQGRYSSIRDWRGSPSSPRWHIQWALSGDPGGKLALQSLRRKHICDKPHKKPHWPNSPFRLQRIYLCLFLQYSGRHLLAFQMQRQILNVSVSNPSCHRLSINETIPCCSHSRKLRRGSTGRYTDRVDLTAQPVYFFHNLWWDPYLLGEIPKHVATCSRA